MNKEKLFNIIDDVLQDCANETIYSEEDEEDITEEELQLIYNNICWYVNKLKDRIGDEFL